MRLFYSFFSEWPAQTHAVSVRLGRPLSIEELQAGFWTKSGVLIEDPFELSHNLAFNFQARHWRCVRSVAVVAAVFCCRPSPLPRCGRCPCCLPSAAALSLHTNMSLFPTRLRGVCRGAREYVANLRHSAGYRLVTRPLVDSVALYPAALAVKPAYIASLAFYAFAADALRAERSRYGRTHGSGDSKSNDE